MRIALTPKQLRDKIELAETYLHRLTALFGVLVAVMLGLGLVVYLNPIPEKQPPGNKSAHEEKLNAVAHVTAGGNSGTAFLVNRSKGYLLTAEHVVRSQGQVQLNFSKANIKTQAKVLASDPKYDLALLQVTGSVSQIPALDLGDSEVVREGDTVIVAGFPRNEWSRNEGKISGKAGEFLRVDASINPGNSGCPVVYKKYFKVVGLIVSTATFEREIGGKKQIVVGQGMHYALPVNKIKQILLSKGYSLD